jgi:hypothetical protein
MMKRRQGLGAFARRQLERADGLAFAVDVQPMQVLFAALLVIAGKQERRTRIAGPCRHVVVRESFRIQFARLRLIELQEHKQLARLQIQIGAQAA